MLPAPPRQPAQFSKLCRLRGAFGEATGLIDAHELFLLRVPAWVGVARESLARVHAGAQRAQVLQ